MPLLTLLFLLHITINPCSCLHLTLSPLLWCRLQWKVMAILKKFFEGNWHYVSRKKHTVQLLFFNHKAHSSAITQYLFNITNFVLIVQNAIIPIVISNDQKFFFLHLLVIFTRTLLSGSKHWDSVSVMFKPALTHFRFWLAKPQCYVVQKMH